MNKSTPLLFLAAAASHGIAQSSAPQAETEAPQAAAEAAPQADLSAHTERPIGWLSDPEAETADPFDALISGKIHFDNRFRIELADTTGRDSSTSITNRIRLGYETKAYYGFSGLVMFDNVATPDSGNYFVPPTGDGTPSRTVVADPPGTRVSQAYGRFATESIGDSGVSLDIRAGRQRIKLDDDRFIGNVGWRQFEQTFDSIRASTNLGIDGLTIDYAYLFGVQRIFGPDGPNPDSDSHIINVSYKVSEDLEIIPFVYLLDFESDMPGMSSNTFGVRVEGSLFRDADDADDLFAKYEFTYAHQHDAGENPADYDADFFAGEVSLVKKNLGAALVGFQHLGSDDGAAAFQFPLGTNHKFQGFADNFLVTPAAGLNDLYVGLKADLPWKFKGTVAYHEFWSDEGSTDFGSEIDFTLARKLTANWSILFKGGFYDGDNGQPDTDRFWVETTVRF